MVGAVMLVAVCFAAETSLPEPTEKPILTVTGKITVTEGRDRTIRSCHARVARRGVIFDQHAMTVRDKGPLFIIYPYDSNPDLKAQKYYSRSVWQIARIEVK
jgi:hypothetical protein